MSLPVDANVQLAAADEADPDHQRCASLLERHPGPLVTTAVVVAEAGWLIDRQLGSAAEAGLYRSIAAGDLDVQALSSDDWDRVAVLADGYADLGLGGVDASLIALAERLQATQIATLDRRDFSVVRPLHVKAFELIP